MYYILYSKWSTDSPIYEPVQLSHHLDDIREKRDATEIAPTDASVSHYKCH